MDIANVVMKIAEAIGKMENQPLLLLFAGLWIIGFLLKEHSALDNNLIPWVLTGIGIALGLVIIAFTFYGAIAGAIIAYLIMAFYDKIKAAINLAKNNI